MSEPHYALPFEVPPAKTDHVTRKMFDIAYAESSPTQKLDIYWPEEGDGPFPVIVSIHGGAFMGGDKRDVQLTPMLESLKRDYVLIGVNYRMSGEAKFPALIHDVKAAIRWIRANAENYLFDPKRIATWGGSAGGYLSLMMGVSTWASELENLTLGNPEQPCHVQAVVDWFGPTDFLKMDQQLAESGFAPPEEFSHNGANSPESLLLGSQITQIPEQVHKANPETYIRSIAPPFFIQHGDQDDTVPHQQSVNMAAKLTDVIGADKVTLELLPNARHADSAFETPQNVKKVLDFLDSILRP